MQEEQPILSHLETQHSVNYKKAVPSETSTKKKQATPTSFQAKSCPPGWASAITNLVAECVPRLMSQISGYLFAKISGYPDA